MCSRSRRSRRSYRTPPTPPLPPRPRTSPIALMPPRGCRKRLLTDVRPTPITTKGPRLDCRGPPSCTQKKISAHVDRARHPLRFMVTAVIRIVTGGIKGGDHNELGTQLPVDIPEGVQFHAIRHGHECRNAVRCRSAVFPANALLEPNREAREVIGEVVLGLDHVVRNRGLAPVAVSEMVLTGDAHTERDDSEQDEQLLHRTSVVCTRGKTYPRDRPRLQPQWASRSSVSAARRGESIGRRAANQAMERR